MNPYSKRYTEIRLLFLYWPSRGIQRIWSLPFLNGWFDEYTFGFPWSWWRGKRSLFSFVDWSTDVVFSFLRVSRLFCWRAFQLNIHTQQYPHKYFEPNKWFGLSISLFMQVVFIFILGFRLFWGNPLKTLSLLLLFVHMLSLSVGFSN